MFNKNAKAFQRGHEDKNLFNKFCYDSWIFTLKQRSCTLLLSHWQKVTSNISHIWMQVLDLNNSKKWNRKLCDNGQSKPIRHNSKNESENLKKWKWPKKKVDKLDFIKIKIFSAPRTLYPFLLLLFRTYTLLDTEEGENT